MKVKAVKIGKKVRYHSIKKDDGTLLGKGLLTEIKSEPWELCGTTVVKIASVIGAVDIENLVEIK